MEDLQAILSRLCLVELNNEESTIHFVPKVDFEDGMKVFANSCYGRMLAKKEFHINGVRNVLIRAWDPCSFTIRRIDRNIFHILFTSEDDLKSVLSRGPWNVGNHLLLLTPWQLRPSHWDDIFWYCDFWAQVRLLPNYAYTDKVGIHLWTSVPTVSTSSSGRWRCSRRGSLEYAIFYIQSGLF